MPGIRKSCKSRIHYLHRLTFHTALHALDNLKAKLRAAFKKKEDKPAEPAPAPAPVQDEPAPIEPTKTEAAAPVPASTLNPKCCQIRLSA